MRRVAVTGLGVISPLGVCVADVLASLEAGRSGVRRLAWARFERLRAPIGGCVDFDGDAHFAGPKLRMLDRVSQFALAAAAQAIADAKLDLANERSDRCGVSVGTGMGGAETTDAGYWTIYAERSDRVQPYIVLGSMTNAAAAWVGIEYGICGPNLTYSTACSSSAVAVGEAARRIWSGDVEVMLEAMRTTASQDPHDPSASCRPFARTRTGLVLGEGAAFIVLEEWDHAMARGAHIRAELTGYGLSNDAVHITRPTVAGQAAAMRAALRSARRDPDDIDYINAHGTATLQNDSVETAAIKEVFGARAYQVPVSSTKSMHGHLLGAAGALEIVIAIACLESGLVPPTMHLDEPDPACDLDYVPGRARSGVELRAIMSNSFAFGGTNAVLIAERPAHSAC
jgi:3-oxoacyl-(acyl-carrier-protein) synthase